MSGFYQPLTSRQCVPLSVTVLYTRARIARHSQSMTSRSATANPFGDRESFGDA